MTVSITELMANRVVQRVAGERYTNLQIPYSASAGVIPEFDVVNSGTTTEVVTWQVGTPFAAGKVTIPVPVGGPYRIRIRDQAVPGTVVTSSNDFYVGENFEFIGQSELFYWFDAVSSPPTPDPQIMQYPCPGGVTQAPSKNGAIAFGNAMRAALDMPIGLGSWPQGGTSLCAVPSGAAYWLDPAQTTSAPWFFYKSYVQNAGRQGVAALIMDLSTTMAGNGMTDHTQMACTAQFWKMFKDYWAAYGVTGIKLFAIPMGNWTGGATDANVQAVRRGLKDCIAILSDAVIGCWRHDLPTVETGGPHPTPSACESIARRMAQTILYEYGVSGMSGVGPAVVSAQEISSTEIDVTCELAPGATTLRQATSGMPSGMKFSADGLVTTIVPNTMTIVAPDKMRFTFTAPLPDGPKWFAYGEGNVAPDTSVVSDDVFPQGDSRAVALQPMTLPIEVI